MKYSLLLAVVLLINLPTQVQAYRTRLDDTGIKRMAKHVDSIKEIAEEHQVPLWILAGIAYNESNGRHDVIGDAGYAFSLMQIRCSTDGRRFSWLPFLRENGVYLTDCHDLMNPYVNLYSAAVILNYHYRRVKNWKKAIMSYHLGYRWYKQKKRAYSYYRRVKYFGEALDIKLRAEYYYVHVFWPKAKNLIREIFT